MKKSIKHKPDFPNIATVIDGIIEIRKSFNNGKLIDVMIPSAIEMKQYLTWKDNYEAFRRIKNVLDTNMKNAETEEQREAYKKEIQAHEQTFRPAPSIYKWEKIRARVVKKSDAGCIVAPAYPKDFKTVTQMGYDM